MTLDQFIRPRRASTLAWGAMLAAGLFTSSARADEWTKRTILTVSEPIQVSNTVLQPGKYVLRLILNSTLGVDRHVVQIFNGEETHIINTIVTQDTVRPHATGTTQFTWWETPPGTAKALRDWYYPGEVNGDEFPYPNNPKQIATYVPPPPVGSAVATAEATTTTTTPAAPPQETVTEQTQTAEVQASPAEQPAAAPPAPQDNSADRAAPPAELPKTGSPYPLIGLCGLAFAGLGGAMLLKRTA